MDEIGSLIRDHRLRLGLTLDAMGARYRISGPSVFKMEKGFVHPSLEIWLRISSDMSMDERDAVLAWIRASLPREFHPYLEELSSDGRKGRDGADGDGAARPYARIKDADELGRAVKADRSIPRALTEVLEDREIRDGFRPTGADVDLVLEILRGTGAAKGGRKVTRAQIVEALRLVREFTDTP